jgi:hypothetical protein
MTLTKVGIARQTPQARTYEPLFGQPMAQNNTSNRRFELQNIVCVSQGKK